MLVGCLLLGSTAGSCPMWCPPQLLAHKAAIQAINIQPGFLPTQIQHLTFVLAELHGVPVGLLLPLGLGPSGWDPWPGLFHLIPAPTLWCNLETGCEWHDCFFQVTYKGDKQDSSKYSPVTSPLSPASRESRTYWHYFIPDQFFTYSSLDTTILREPVLKTLVKPSWKTALLHPQTYFFYQKQISLVDMMYPR